MPNRQRKRRALVNSVVSLLICCSMFIGTTFAWMTDSVSSLNNKIASGNLDVEMYYLNGEEYMPVQEETNLFETENPWKPGSKKMVNMKIANLGTLALAYEMQVYIAEEVKSITENDVDIRLSEHLKFGVIDGKFEGTCEEAVQSLEASGSNAIQVSEINTKKSINDIYKHSEGTLYPKPGTSEKIAEKEFTFVVWMPDTVGNEASTKSGEEPPSVTLGVNLVATQTAYEDDSFGADYDEEPRYTKPVATADELFEALSVSDKETEIVLTQDIDLSGEEWSSVGMFKGTLDGKGYAIQNMTDENGLFESLDGATIRNLKIENAAIVAESNHTGILAGSIAKNETTPLAVTTIENVTVSGTVNGGDYYTGGLIGAVSSYHAVIRNCVNYATVTSSGQQVGGIAGYAKRDTQIIDCVNEGTVSGGYFVGGIIGLMAAEDDDTSLIVTIKNCENKGTVTATDGEPYSKYVGGIAGVFGREGGKTPVNACEAYITGCKTSGELAICGGLLNVATGKEELLTLHVSDN